MNCRLGFWANAAIRLDVDDAHRCEPMQCALLNAHERAALAPRASVHSKFTILEETAIEGGIGWAGRPQWSRTIPGRPGRCRVALYSQGGGFQSGEVRAGA